jgi:hypothetical protein
MLAHTRLRAQVCYVINTIKQHRTLVSPSEGFVARTPTNATSYFVDFVSSGELRWRIHCAPDNGLRTGYDRIGLLVLTLRTPPVSDNQNWPQ